MYLDIQKLKAALVFAAKKDIRTYLNGININLAKNRVEATNGHALIVIEKVLIDDEVMETEEKPNKNYIIKREDVECALKAFSKGSNAVKFIINDDEKTIQLGNLICYPLEGHFPEVDRLLNLEFSTNPPQGTQPAFQTCYLEKVGKAMKIMKTKSPPYWRPDFFGKDAYTSCMQVVDDMKMILMPLRID